MKKLIDKILKKFGYYTLQDIQKGSVTFNNRVYRVEFLQIDHVISKHDYENSYLENKRLENNVVDKLREKVLQKARMYVDIDQYKDELTDGGKRFKAKLIVLEPENKNYAS